MGGGARAALDIQLLPSMQRVFGWLGPSCPPLLPPPSHWAARWCVFVGDLGLPALLSCPPLPSHWMAFAE